MANFRRELYEKYRSISRTATRKTPWGLGLQRWYDIKYDLMWNGLDSQSTILDLGCGSGEFLEYLAQKGFQNIQGIDISPEQVSLAVSKSLPVELGDAVQYLQKYIERYDAIFAIDFLEHFSKDELIILTKAITRSLKPGGRLLIQTPNGQGLTPGYVIYGDLSHYTIFNSSSLTQLLILSGFSDIHFRETGPAFPIHLPLFVMWQAIRLIAMGIKFIENGRLQMYWTENLICICRKVEAG